MACAFQIKANFIILKNIRDFIDIAVPAIRPLELLERI